MTVVELYSKSDCHLCDEAKEALVRVQKQYPFDLRVILMDERHVRYEEFKNRIPVIYINKEFAFQYRVPEKLFVEKLKSATARP